MKIKLRNKINQKRMRDSWFSVDIFKRHLGDLIIFIFSISSFPLFLY